MTGRSNEKEAPRKYKDHAMDALRYLITSRPEGPRPDDPIKKLENDYSIEGGLRKELYSLKKPKKPDPINEF